jgi:hypothetical protein
VTDSDSEEDSPVSTDSEATDGEPEPRRPRMEPDAEPDTEPDD